MAGSASLPSADDFFGPPPPPSADEFFGAAPAPKPAAAPWSLDTITRYAGPGQISSAGRSPARNAAVGGSKTSSHLDAQALDFVPKDRDTARAAKALAAAGVPYDQIIDEGTHVHVGWGPQMRGQFSTKKGLLPSAAQFFGENISAPIVNAWQGGQRRREQAEALMREGNQQYAPPGQAGDPINSVVGLGKMAMGGFSWLTSPIGGAAEGVAGTPLESATKGALPKEMMGDYAEAMTGFLAGGAKPKGPVPGEVQYRPFRATKAERAAAPTADEFFGPSPIAAAVKPSADEFFGPAMAAKVEDNLDDVLMGPRARKAGTLSLPEPTTPPLPKGVKENLLDAAASVQKILAPATRGEGVEAASTIRRASAQGDLLAAQSTEALLQHARQVSELTVPEQRALVGYIETRSAKGVKLADPGLQKAADTIRKVNETYRNRIGEVMVGDEGPSFIQDYYTHMWKDAPGDVVRAMSARQGSGRNLKARSIPTLEEGIAAGLTPVTENPIEATSLYAANMSRYLATVDVQKTLADTGFTKWAAPGQEPPGWVRLSGIRTERPSRVIIKDSETQANLPPQYLYAPEDAARVYNNWISSGFERGDSAALFEPVRRASNAMTMLKLGLSAFHATTMAQEGIISEMARGYQAASRGDVLTAGKAMAGAPLAPVTRALRGGRMRKELLGLKTPDSFSAAVNDAFIRAGGRVRMDPLLRTRGAGSFYNAIHRGTWKAELKATASRIFGKDRQVSERAMGVLDLGANLIQTVAAPLFETYIPRLKQGAFASNMEDWLKAHPNAAQAEIDAAAHLINRSIDNRFGEMAWDNLFWHRWLKQASQILLLSPTWNMGTINEIGGGLVDLLGDSARGLIQGKGVTQRTAYVAALASYVPLINGIMTYLKTGTAPQGMDFLVYRTGGTDPASQQPERALLPGYQKDVYAFGYDFPNHIAQEVENKLNPALKTVLELSGNRDWADHPIRDVNGTALDQMGQTGDYLLEQFMPISLGQLKEGRKVGSNLSSAERLLAVRPAPSYLTSPERVERLKKLRARADWARKQRFDRIQESRREKH